MLRKDIWAAIEIKLRSEKKFFPGFPDHPCGQVCMVATEAGKLMQAALAFKYIRMGEGKSEAAQLEDMKQAALSTIANAIRFLENIDKLKVDTDKQETVLNGLL